MTALTTDTYLGLRMRLLRQAKRLSLRALGERLGVSDQTILNLELGRTSWHVRDLLAFAEALDCDPIVVLADLRAGTPLTAEGQVELLTQRIADLERQLAAR